MDIDLEKKIIRLISAHLGIPEKEINPKSNLRKDFEVETLTIVDLLAKIQEELKINLEEVEVKKIRTVGQLIDLITTEIE